PAGEFLMGSTERDIAAVLREYKDYNHREGFLCEQPQHHVYLDGYWIYKYEVTVGQYRMFCKATRRKMPEAPGWGGRTSIPS
ncbi:MAG: SUMF1/EgtB/PvdO family nonheme iron enzyme, partial [Armatimonadetes bacterium]|nr:SUMF1/EgtB/PvdO family nonheme iron enzyme [Armatimonadota bacterium]